MSVLFNSSTDNRRKNELDREIKQILVEWKHSGMSQAFQSSHQLGSVSWLFYQFKFANALAI